MNAWEWLTKTDAGLAARVVGGAAVFAVLACVDLRRNGRQATRWREYLFLAAAVALAMVYGVVNDQLTSRISWEYFYYGKGLAAVLGPATPPDGARLAREATKVGLRATWTAGLIVGVAMLLANNPRRERRQLSYRSLFGRVPTLLYACVVCACLLGAAGYASWLTGLSGDFGDMVREDLFRPYRFMAVYGIHLGGYVGGAMGTAWAVVSIWRERRASAKNFL